MKGIKCDRCGTFYGEPCGCFVIKGSEPHSEWGFTVDLCGKCYKELKKIIMKKKQEENGRGRNVR